jgi:hypothetical protein
MNMSKDQKVAKVKKGAVIPRRNNRTVNTDVAQHDPKWVMHITVNKGSSSSVLVSLKDTRIMIKRDPMTGHWQNVKAA